MSTTLSKTDEVYLFNVPLIYPSIYHVIYIYIYIYIYNMKVIPIVFRGIRTVPKNLQK